MRSIACLALALMLVGCAAEPPLRDAAAVPVALESIVDNQLGVWPLDRKPTRTWEALKFTRERHVRRDRSLIVTFKDAPVREVRYYFGRSFSDSEYGDIEPTHTIVVFAQPKGKEDVILPQLEAAGLAPAGIVGIDTGTWLTTATADPEWMLRWLDGRVYSAVRAPAGKQVRDVLDYRGVADLEVSTTDKKKRDLLLRQLRQMQQPNVPDTGTWHADTAALAERFYGELLAPLRDKMADVDRRMAKARTLRDRLSVFAEIREVVVAAHFGTKNLLPPVSKWHAGHYKSVRVALEKAFEGQYLDRRGVYGPYYMMRETIGRHHRQLRDSGGAFGLEDCKNVLGYAEQFAALRASDPYREFGRRLRWLRSSKTPRGTQAEYWAKVAKNNLLERTKPAREEGYAAQVHEYIRGYNLRRSFNYPKAASVIERLGETVKYAEAPFVSIERDLAALQRCVVQTRVTATFAELAAERLLAGCKGQPVVDQAVARAVAKALGDKDAVARTLESGWMLLREARKVPQTGPMNARLAAYAQLATKTSKWGPACEGVAAELSLPAGRELAKKAAAVARVGDHGKAALLYVQAATLGNRTSPAPASSWSTRRAYSALVAAEKKNELEGVDERVQWLIRARMQAYLVAVLSLPVTAADEPIYDLQDRFLRAQLAGRARLSTTFGLRLAGLSDVRRKRKPAEDVRLVELGGKIVWRRKNEGGKVVDLSRYKIDRDGWRRYRQLRDELNQAEADLRAARKSGGTPRATLEKQQQDLNTEIMELNQRIQQRAVDPSTANAEIARLKRESAALQNAIANFNRRNDHIRERTRAFNAKVPPHNQLLERLLAEQATAYEQLLRPSNVEFAESKIASCGRGTEEQRLRRWILGLVEAPDLEASVPVPHPSALATRVRDVSDPAVAAKDILGSLQRRLSDRRLWSGVTTEQHLTALKDAVVAYGRQYGTEDLFARVMQARIVPKDRYGQIVSFFSDKKRRDALKKMIDGK